MWHFKRLWPREPRIQNEDEFFISSALLPIVEKLL